MTSWEEASHWYDTIVGKEGHYYHKQVIMPKLLPLLNLQSDSALVDLGCGQGILAQMLPKTINYCGVDLSKTLIAKAPKGPTRRYIAADVCKPIPLEHKSFTHATFILSLQNMQQPDLAIAQASSLLKDGGSLVLVLNHPCFRIPRQTHWQIDEKQKLQYRRINRYMTAMDIPVDVAGTITHSFHHPLSDYSTYLHQSGFVITHIQEWVSDKLSTGRASKMENLARKEFPLFMTLRCEKTLKISS